MPSNYTQEETFGKVDLDDRYLTEKNAVDAYLAEDLYVWGAIQGVGQPNLGIGKYLANYATDILPNVAILSQGPLIRSKKWQHISAQASTTGQHALQIFSDGTLWSWGMNASGQLGLGNTISQSSPVQVGTATNWKLCYTLPGTEANTGASYAIKTDGTLWSWGVNTLGQLGLGNTVSQSSPVQVGTATNWKQLNTDPVRTPAIIGLLSTGSIYYWGGALGTLFGTTFVARSSPTQIGSATDWNIIKASKIHFLGIKQNGTLWTCGQSSAGLGLGNTAAYSSPVQIGSDTNWKDVSIAGGFNNNDNKVLAIKTDGTLWAWGYNNAGNLGLGDTVARSSPTQVGTLTNWKTVITAGGNWAGSAAIKTDGTLWVWGKASAYALNPAGGFSSPVQIGSGTNWSNLYANTGTYSANVAAVIFATKKVTI